MEIKQTIKEEENMEIIAVDQETGELYVPQTVIDHLTQIETARKEFDKYEKQVKAQLKEAMEKYKITTIDTDGLLISYVAPSERITVDSKMLKTAFPEVYDACSKVSEVRSSVRIKVR